MMTNIYIIQFMINYHVSDIKLVDLHSHYSEIREVQRKFMLLDMNFKSVSILWEDVRDRTSLKY